MVYDRHSSPQDLPVELLHELQHVADNWLKIFPRVEKETILFSSIKAVFEPVVAGSQMGGATAVAGLSLYARLSGAEKFQKFNSDEAFIYFIFALTFLAMSLYIEPKAVAALRHHYLHNDKKEISARESSNRSLLVAENVPKQFPKDHQKN